MMNPNEISIPVRNGVPLRMLDMSSPRSCQPVVFLALIVRVTLAHGPHNFSQVSDWLLGPSSDNARSSIGA